MTQTEHYEKCTNILHKVQRLGEMDLVFILERLPANQQKWVVLWALEAAGTWFGEASRK